MSREQRQQIRTRLQRPSAASETTPTLEQIRTGFAQMMSEMRNAEDVAVAETELGGHRTLRVDPDGEAGPGTILYFHGGSHRMGSPETAMSLTSALVSLTGFAAFSVDYPLSPEHPYPADQEVCLAAYRELLDRGTDPQSIVIAGDSAGGGLTMSTALRARDAGLPLPAGLLLFSPGLDCTRSGESMTTKEGRDPFFTAAGLREGGLDYIGDHDPRDPYLSPAIAGDLSGLPPILLQAGTDEVLLDDSTRLAVRARDAEVDVVLDVVAGVPHVFPAFVGVLDEADDALERAALFLTQRVRRGFPG